MPEIAIDAVCSASRTHHCVTNKPKGDGDLHSPGEAEHARATAIPCEHVMLGARLITIEEPPGNLPAWRMEDAVYESAVPTANCKLACTESCKRGSSLTLFGEDIV